MVCARSAFALGTKAPISRFSCTVISGNTCRPSGTWAMPSSGMRWGGRDATSVPAKMMLPVERFTSPEPARGEFADQRARRVDLGRIQARHHLVEQQDFWLRRERAGHLQTALVDGREVLRGRVRMRGEADEVDRLLRFLAGGGDMAVAQ